MIRPHPKLRPRSARVADLKRWAKKGMNPLIEAIAGGWSWKLGKPIAVIATNRFGNAIVQNADGHFFRIMPEEWQCESLASSPAQLEEERKKAEFIRDWEMTAIVARAEAALGPLSEGEVYHLVIPGMLGGKYVEENIRKIGLQEVLAYSGEMAKQMIDVPDGGSVIIAPTETEPNKRTTDNSGASPLRV